jgi:hypothetical protein
MCTWKNSNSSSTNGGCEKWGRKFLKAWWFQLRNRGEKLFNINRKLQQRLHRLQNSSLCLPCSVPWASTYFQCTHITFCIQYDLPCVPTSIKVRTYWQRTGLFVEGKIRVLKTGRNLTECKETLNVPEKIFYQFFSVPFKANLSSLALLYLWSMYCCKTSSNEKFQEFLSLHSHRNSSAHDEPFSLCMLSFFEKTV